MRIPQKLLFAKINISPIAELVAAQTFAGQLRPRQWRLRSAQEF